MLFVNQKPNSYPFSIKIGTNSIQHSDRAKYLGVWLDEQLSWSPHISQLECKLSKCAAVLFKIRHYVNEEALKSLYYSLAYTHLQYAVCAWGKVSKTALHRLNVLHNKIIRCITFSSFQSHVTPLYYKLKILKLPDIYQLELGKVMHRLHLGMLPPTYNHLFTRVSNIHSYSTRGAAQGKYFWPSVNNELGKKSLQYSGPKFWSSIDPSILDLSPFGFKRLSLIHI